ncbi:MAG: lytic transglycosylase domain-containing protein [archaeon]
MKQKNTAGRLTPKRGRSLPATIGLAGLGLFFSFSEADMAQYTALAEIMQTAGYMPEAPIAPDTTQAVAPVPTGSPPDTLSGHDALDQHLGTEVSMPASGTGSSEFQQISARIARYDQFILKASQMHGNVGYELIKAVIYEESGGNPRAVSRKGARGLMQLMPRTAAKYKVRANELFDPEKNILAGTHYLSDLMKQYGNDNALVLVAYNAGPGRLENALRAGPDHSWGSIEQHLYPETRRFVADVLAKSEQFALYSRGPGEVGNPEHPLLPLDKAYSTAILQ